MSVSHVHTGAWANDLLRVGFARGEGVGFVFFGVGKRGRAGREVIDRLHERLQSMVEQRQGGTEVPQGQDRSGSDGRNRSTHVPPPARPDC